VSVVREFVLKTRECEGSKLGPCGAFGSVEAFETIMWGYGRTHYLCLSDRNKFGCVNVNWIKENDD
jgi:hypothetical protein